MGADQVTLQNLAIVQADTARRLLLVKGNVPGAMKSLVVVQGAVKVSK